MKLKKIYQIRILDIKNLKKITRKRKQNYFPGEVFGLIDFYF